MTRKYTLNGLEKSQPNGATYIVKSVPKKKYLRDILHRLRDDVGVIIGAVEVHNKAHKDKIGFFPLVRMVMPIIEVIASSEGRSS